MTEKVAVNVSRGLGHTFSITCNQGNPCPVCEAEAPLQYIHMSPAAWPSPFNNRAWQINEINRLITLIWLITDYCITWNVCVHPYLDPNLHSSINPINVINLLISLICKALQQLKLLSQGHKQIPNAWFSLHWMYGWFKMHGNFSSSSNWSRHFLGLLWYKGTTIKGGPMAIWKKNSWDYDERSLMISTTNMLG